MTATDYDLAAAALHVVTALGHWRPEADQPAMVAAVLSSFRRWGDEQ